MNFRPLLLCAWLALGAVHAQSAPAAVAARVDHFQIEHDSPQALFTLFAEVFQLPVVWPMADYGAFASGGLYFGNVVVEFGRFGGLPAHAQGPARLAGIALQPALSAPASAAELERRQLRHRTPAPFMANGKALWTVVRIDGIAPPGARLFICDYHIDTETGLRAAAAELARLQGGPLGLVGVRELLIEAAEPVDALVRWRALLAPVGPDDAGAFRFASGPLIQVRQGAEDRLRLLTLEVRSLQTAQQLLLAEGFVTDPADPGRLSGSGQHRGLTLQLVLPPAAGR